MSLVFRNIDTNPEDPVETWPVEAVATALSRGDLPHWRRLARAIEKDPWGPVARAVETAVEMDQPYGSGPLLLGVIERARGRNIAGAKKEVAARITEMIMASGLSRRDCARRLGTSASRLSTYSRGSVTPGADMLLRIAAVTGHRIRFEPVAPPTSGEGADRGGYRVGGEGAGGVEVGGAAAD